MSTLPRRVTECDLRKLRSEHDAYHALQAEATRRERLMSVVGRVPLELVHDAAACRGASCRQGRQPCRENCNPIKEMSVYAPDDERDSRAKAEWDSIILVGAILVIAALLAGAVVWMSYHYADPVLAALGRVLN